MTRAQREKQNTHCGAIVWLTGLPASGKSTIAQAVAENLHRMGFQTAVLDGDNIRRGLCADLGFSVADRHENIRRVGEVAKLFLEQGVVVFVALISPVRSAREKMRQSIPASDFIEVYCSCPLSVCRERDPRGLYAKAESGMIAEFTGVSSPYEAPLNADVTLDTSNDSVEKSVSRLSGILLDKLRNVAAP